MVLLLPFAGRIGSDIPEGQCESRATLPHGTKKILSALRKFISDSEEDEIDLDKRHSIDKQKPSCK